MDSASLHPTFPSHYDVSSMDREPPGNPDLAENIKAMYRLLDLISESGSKLKFRKDLTSDDKKTMKFNPEHIPKPIVSDQRSCKSHLPLCLRVVLHRLIQIAKRLRCFRMIRPRQISHAGPHTNGKETKGLHFCEAQWVTMTYFQNHETSHGSESMTQTRWAAEGQTDKSRVGGELMTYRSLNGKRVYIACSRAADGCSCDGADVQHINDSAITHGLYWRRLRFKDPYSRREQIHFANGFDAMCPGPGHLGTPAGMGQPSYCALPMSHDPRSPNDAVNGLGCFSSYRHLFKYNNPVVMQQAFHVIFVIDRSDSMSYTDRSPLASVPGILPYNRLGAVYSALYNFWSARRAAVTVGRCALRDAYSHSRQLLNAVQSYEALGARDFSGALRFGQVIMEQNWSTKRLYRYGHPRSLSLCSSAWVCHNHFFLQKYIINLTQRNPLSFHSILFGKDGQCGAEIQSNAPCNPRMPPSVPSSFAIAPKTKELVERFLDIAGH
ncbi:hypothetical protein BJV77DRAFT_1007857 [Russula vinacea]|nr:hypothetical protein BJV77DRAFT_1007857 [Russula vinacea]